MVLRPPRSTRTATLVPYTTLFLSTSGVLLLARTPRAAAYFSKSFSGRTARKVYWALVVGVPEVKDGFINLPLAKQPGTGGEKMHVDEANGLHAHSRYRVIARAANRAACVELQPPTACTHQLPVHMAVRKAVEKGKR